MEEYLKASLEVYDWIEQNRIDGPNGISYEINPGGFEDLTGGPVHGKHSLYSGSAGIGSFLLRLYDVTRDEKYLEEAKEVAREIIAETPGKEFYLEKYENALSSSLKVIGWHTGVYSGPIGAGVFILELYEKTKDEQYLGFAKRLEKDLYETATRTENGIYFSGDLDLFSDAGFMLYYISLYEETDDKIYIEKATEIASYISAQAIRDDKKLYWKANDLSQVGMPAGSIYPGLSHGTAGIAYTFSALYAYSGQEFLLDDSIKAAAFLESIADLVGEGLLIPYLHNPNPSVIDAKVKKQWDNKYYIGFCHGPAGTVLLYRKLYQITKDKHYLNIVEKLSKGIIESGAPEHNSWGLWNSYCWCCGTPGLIEHFVEMYELTGNYEYVEYAKRSASRVIADSYTNLDSSKCFYGYWDRTNPRGVETYTGLYIGAAGAAAGLLRLYAHENEIKLTDFWEYKYI